MITVTPATTTTYSVAGTDSISCTGHASVLVTVTGCTFLDEHSAVLLQIMPNPAQAEFRIRSGHAGPKTVDVFNATGGRVLQAAFCEDDLHVDASSFGPGLYHLVLHHHGGTVVKTVCITR
jgi:hypothetical protein